MPSLAIQAIPSNHFNYLPLLPELEKKTTAQKEIILISTTGAPTGKIKKKSIKKGAKEHIQ